MLAHARDGCQGLVEFVESLQHLRQFWRILSCSLDGALIEQALVSVSWSLAGAERQLCGSLRPMQAANCEDSNRFSDCGYRKSLKSNMLEYLRLIAVYISL